MIKFYFIFFFFFLNSRYYMHFLNKFKILAINSLFGYFNMLELRNILGKVS